MSSDADENRPKPKERLARKTHPFKNHPYVQYLHAARQREGISQEDVADRAGISKTTISFVFRGIQDPRTITNPIHEAIAKTLNIPMGKLIQLAGPFDLFEGEDIPHAAVIAQVEEIPFPPINSLVDIANLDDQEAAVLVRMLEVRKKPRNGTVGGNPSPNHILGV